VQRRILVRAHEIVSQVEAARKALALEEDGEASIPVPVLTARECQALIRTSVSLVFIFNCLFSTVLVKRTRLKSCGTLFADHEGEESKFLPIWILTNAQRTNLPLPEVAVNDILAFCATHGDKDGADRVLVNYLIGVFLPFKSCSPAQRPQSDQRRNNDISTSRHISSHRRSMFSQSPLWSLSTTTKARTPQRLCRPTPSSSPPCFLDPHPLPRLRHGICLCTCAMQPIRSLTSCSTV